MELGVLILILVIATVVCLTFAWALYASMNKPNKFTPGHTERSAA
jgi:hypothetical protein